MLLDDQLASYELAARTACAGLADRVTSRQMGLQAPTVGSAWLDIAITEAEFRGDPRQRAEVVVNTVISVAVRHTDVGVASRLEHWIDNHAFARILHLQPLARELYAKIEGGQSNQVASDISGTMVVYHQRTLRSTLANYKLQSPAVLGLTTHTDGGSTDETGRAYDVYPQRMIAWASPGILVGPCDVTVIYAGAALGNVVEVLDVNDNIVATVAVGSWPVGSVVVPALPMGDYRARIIDVVTDATVQISERPA